jgi:phospholipase A-2-activating protein
VAEAHKDIIRQIVPSGDEIPGVWTCSNDGTAKQWLLSGDLVRTVSNVESSAFVFGVAVLNEEAVFTASDDGLLTVFRSETAVQVLRHGSTLWGVAVDRTSGVVATACADGKVRLFSTDGAKVASSEELAEFETGKIDNSKEEVDMKSVTNISLLATTVGKKSGEVKMFTDGVEVFAYQWDGKDWVLLGTVTGAMKESTKKKAQKW